MSEPVARVFVHKTGGNVGIRWSGVPVDGAPLMHDGELLYTADAIREAVEAEREACAKVCEAIAAQYPDGKGHPADPQPPADVPRLKASEIHELLIDERGVERFGVELARAVEAEVRRRCGVAA